ncbi:hypothetical protein J1605_007043 [Eschrichtius robustus]|uniref:Uncharacterized protein n=1 Tax=Eschrichtius robustus TaxID=9764 RepID=A0AB34H1A0_ESCRO|nr:hypothetical protein J1605_007043 [Eschrichtius robustus]
MSKTGTLYSTFDFHPSPELCPIANPTSGRQGVWIGERYGRGSTWKRYRGSVVPLAGTYSVGDEFVLAMAENFIFTRMLSTRGVCGD